MELIGRIKIIGDVIQVSDKFVKRDVIVTTNDKYPQDIKVEFSNDKVDEVNNFNEGQDVKIAFRLRGSIWNEKYFVSVSGWKIEAASGGSPRPSVNKPAYRPNNNAAQPHGKEAHRPQVQSGGRPAPQRQQQQQQQQRRPAHQQYEDSPDQESEDLLF